MTATAGGRPTATPGTGPHQLAAVTRTGRPATSWHPPGARKGPSSSRRWRAPALAAPPSGPRQRRATPTKVARAARRPWSAQSCLPLPIARLAVIGSMAGYPLMSWATCQWCADSCGVSSSAARKCGLICSTFGTAHCPAERTPRSRESRRTACRWGGNSTMVTAGQQGGRGRRAQRRHVEPVVPDILLGNPGSCRAC
jgi:hypothetical protein